MPSTSSILSVLVLLHSCGAVMAHNPQEILSRCPSSSRHGMWVMSLDTAGSATNAPPVLDCPSRLPLFMRCGPVASPAWFTITAMAVPRSSAASLDALRLSLSRRRRRVPRAPTAPTDQSVFRLARADLLARVFGSVPAGAGHATLRAPRRPILPKIVPIYATEP